MNTDETRAARAAALLKQLEFSPQETARRLKAAYDIEQWRRLVPFASIEGSAPLGAGVRIADDVAARERRRLDEDGYFHLDSVFDQDRITKMYRIVEAVRADGWPAVFAFVFDDFWDVARSPSVSSFLEAALGKRFLQNSCLWIHWVAGAKGVRGWDPHVDLIQAAEKEFLSVWISLSDATVENGCIFLVRPSGIPSEVAEAIGAQESLTYPLYVRLLRNVVALPVPAGSLIGWRSNVLHWGGINSGSDAPRVSLALEFRSRDARTFPFETPMHDQREALPPFSRRLFAIARRLRDYRVYEPVVSRYLPLAERILSEAPDPR